MATWAYQAARRAGKDWRVLRSSGQIPQANTGDLCIHRRLEARLMGAGFVSGYKAYPLYALQKVILTGEGLGFRGQISLLHLKGEIKGDAGAAGVRPQIPQTTVFKPQGQ